MTGPQQSSLLEVVPSAPTRRRDPVTSLHAARTVKVTETQRKVLTLLRMHGPVTDEELIRRFRDAWPDDKTTDQSIRSRRAELVRKGLVSASNDFGRTASGNKAMRWRVVT